MSGGRSGVARGGVVRLLALVTLVAGCSGGSATAPTPAGTAPTPAGTAPTPAGTATPPASATPPGPTSTPAVAGWTVSLTPPMAGGPGGAAPVTRAVAGPPVAIAVGADGAVIVGERFIADPSPDAAATAFHSDDLATWRPAVLDAGLDLGSSVPTSGPLVGMTAVTWGSPGFVATGIDLAPGVTGVAWWSVDGRRWTRSELPGAATARPSAVAWNGGRYVAVGIDEAARAPRMAVWTSTDGVSWHRVPDGPAFDVGDYQDTMEYRAWAGPVDLVAAGPAGFVAVGRRCVGGRAYGDRVECAAVVWRSPDGSGWTAERSPDPLLGSVVAGAVAPDGGAPGSTGGGRAPVVLVGATADGFGDLEGGRVVIADPDDATGAGGTAWDVVTPDGLPGLADVALLDGVLYAVGDPVPRAVDAEPAISLWRSADGRDWERIAGLPALPSTVMSVRGVAVAAAGSRLAILVSVVLDGEPAFGGVVIAGAPPRS